MSSELRQFVRICTYIVLVFCALIDGGLGEEAISGCCDVGHSANGHLFFPGPEPELWPWIVVFILVQGALVFAVFRLRDRKAQLSILVKN